MTVGLQAGAIVGQTRTDALCTVQKDDDQNQRQDNPHCIEDNVSRYRCDSDTRADKGNAQQHDPTDKSAECYASLAPTRCGSTLSSQFIPRGQ
jgi:hypothetical protein